MFSLNCCHSGERSVRDVPVNSSAEALAPKKDGDKQDGEADEKKEDTQPADKEKEEKSTSTASKNNEENTFLVRMRTRSYV